MDNEIYVIVHKGTDKIAPAPGARNVGAYTTKGRAEATMRRMSPQYNDRYEVVPFVMKKENEEETR